MKSCEENRINWGSENEGSKKEDKIAGQGFIIEKKKFRIGTF
jgi:hypothetical protein